MHEGEKELKIIEREGGVNERVRTRKLHEAQDSG